MDEQKSQFQQLLSDATTERKSNEETFNKEAQGYIDILKGFKTQAEKLVHVIGNTGMVGGYQRVANEERKASRFWKAVAGSSMMGLIGFGIYTFLITAHSGFTWGVFAGRGLVVIGFGILSAYAASLAASMETPNGETDEWN